jgi:hypothetical protein
MCNTIGFTPQSGAWQWLQKAGDPLDARSAAGRSHRVRRGPSSTCWLGWCERFRRALRAHFGGGDITSESSWDITSETTLA